MTKPLRNTWEGIKEYINSKDCGTLISRKDLQSLAGNNPTVDYYRRCCTVVGYLEDTERPGKYKIKSHIPTGMSSSGLRKVVDSLNGARVWIYHPGDFIDPSKTVLKDYIPVYHKQISDIKILSSVEKDWCRKCSSNRTCQEPCLGIRVAQSEIISEILEKLKKDER